MAEESGYVSREEIRELVRFIREQEAKLNDRFFSLSTGALALSITFKGSFVPKNPDVLWALGGSWLLFLLCILMYLINRAIGVGRANAITIMMEAEVEADTLHDCIYKPPTYVKVLWLTELVAFLLGVSLLVVFALANIGGTPS